jgi:hypothetical protein
MLIRGLWTLWDDSIIRPVVEGEVLAADGSWLPVELLVDVGADRTVFTAGVLATLVLPQLPAPHSLGGVGGTAATAVVATQLRLPLDSGASIKFQGTFAGFLQAEALEMSLGAHPWVLGAGFGAEEGVGYDGKGMAGGSTYWKAGFLC